MPSRPGSNARSSSSDRVPHCVAVFGAAFAGYLADKIGRKRTIQFGSVIASIGCAIQTGATNVGQSDSVAQLDDSIGSALTHSFTIGQGC